MNKTTWQLENEAQENAFARRLLVEYNIKETTTQRQAINGTREFEFPVRARKHTHHSKSERLKLACFKSGYVRNQNSCYSNYQLNPTYKREKRYVFLENNKTITRKYTTISRAKIYSGMARLKFMLEFYLRNYKTNTNKVR
jgi:hypothetical protein